MIKQRKRPGPQRAGVRFQRVHEGLKKNPWMNLCKYVTMVIVFFLIMYIFMLTVTSIPIGDVDDHRNTNKQPPKPALDEHRTKHEADTATKLKPDTDKKINRNKDEAAAEADAFDPKSKNEYILFPNYMAPQVRGKSKGLFEKFEARHDHNLVQLYCDSLKDGCIGYAFNKGAGYQFYSPSAFPMAAKTGWEFYLKHDPSKALDLTDKGVAFGDLSAELQAQYKQKRDDDDDDDDKVQLKLNDDDDDAARPTGRFISYAQNVGRVNNQLVSFEAMIQYALYYNRTLVIPWPRHANHVMGFECGFWDFERLRQVIDIIVEHELPQHLQNYREEDGVPKQCRFIKLVGKGISTEANTACEMIYLYEGDMGIFHFADGPQNVMKYMTPAKYIRDAVQTFLIDTFGTLTYRVGVHRRAMDEGGKDPKTGEKHVCRWESHGIEGDGRFAWIRSDIRKTAGDDDDMYKQIIGVYHHSCAMDFYDLQNILIFHQQSPIDSEHGETFFVAHDHQEPWAINAMRAKGATTQPDSSKKEKGSSVEWSRANECNHIHRTQCQRYGHCATPGVLRMKEEILWDMWALYHAEFLVGTWMSTLTRTICHWKGFEESLYTGNQCFLKWKWRDTVSGKKTDWFTLEGLNRTALFD